MADTPRLPPPVAEMSLDEQIALAEMQVIARDARIRHRTDVLVRRFKHEAIKHAGGGALLGLATVGLCIWMFQDQHAFLPAVIGYPILAAGLAALVAAGASPHCLIGRWRVPGAGLIAAMAYSLYLTHKPIYHLVRQVLGPQLAGHPLWGFVVFGAAAFAGGALLYLTFERPALILRDRILHARRARAARGINPEPAAP